MITGKNGFSVFLALFAGLALHACSGKDDSSATRKSNEYSQPNVVIILVDTLRADHLGCYGYERDTSPNMDRLAREGVQFENALSPSSYTRESVAALFTGKFPSSNPWGSGWIACPDPAGPLLAESFREAGYATLAFYNNPAIHDRIFFKGFDEKHQLNQHVSISGKESALSVEALKRLDDRDAAKPFLLYLHYLDPHGPYEPANAYYHKFAEKRFEQPLKLYDEVRGNVTTLAADGFGPGDPRFEDLVLRYDAEINVVDDAIGQVLDGLKKRGLDKNTIIVLMSDHGEEFLEHGFVEHCWDLHRESIHVPLVFWWPGHIEPQRIPGYVSTVNVFPTLLGLADIASPQGLDGYSLLSDNSWHVRDVPIFSEMMIQSRLMMRVVQQGDYAFISAPKWLDIATRSEVARVHRDLVMEFATGKRDARSIWHDPEREFLYEIRTDAQQQHDLLESKPEIAAKYRAILAEYRAQCPPAKSEMEQRALTGFGMDPEMEERMKTLGYL